MKGSVLERIVSALFPVFAFVALFAVRIVYGLFFEGKPYTLPHFLAGFSVTLVFIVVGGLLLGTWRMAVLPPAPQRTVALTTGLHQRETSVGSPSVLDGMDLTDVQWAVLEPTFRPRRRPDGRGRPWTDPRAVMNGVLWVLRTGAPWHDLPSSLSAVPDLPSSPPPSTRVSPDLPWCLIGDRGYHSDGLDDLLILSEVLGAGCWGSGCRFLVLASAGTLHPEPEPSTTAPRTQNRHVLGSH